MVLSRPVRADREIQTMLRVITANPRNQVIRHIEDLFGDIYAADEVEVWLTRPQALLDGVRPIDLIEAGEGEAAIRVANEILDGTLI